MQTPPRRTPQRKVRQAMNEPVYRRLTVEEAAVRLRGNTDTLVTLHRHPDGDAVGSAFALRILLENMGCRALCVCDDEIPDRLRFLTDGEQDSILRENLPPDFLPAQIIAVDTASPTQMGALYDLFAGRVDLMIDHHGKGEMYADGWIVPESAATGEMMLALAEELVRAGRLSAIPTGAMRLMYAAVSSDTGCFRFANVTPQTHRAAAVLLAAGVDAADINHRLFELKSAPLLRAEKVGLDRMRLLLDGRVGVIDMPIDVKRANGLSDEHLETVVEIPRAVESVEVAVAIRQGGDEPTYRVSMRASGDVDVSEICAAFGGGGHKKAAGCSITCDGGTETVIDMVVEAVRRVLEA